MLGVPEMVAAYQEQTKSMDRVNQLFEKRLAELVDAAYQAKYNEKVEHLLKAAHLRIPVIVQTLLDMDAMSQASLEQLVNVAGQNQYDRKVITTDPATSIIPMRVSIPRRYSRATGKRYTMFPAFCFRTIDTPNRSSSLLFTATSAGGSNRCGISAAGWESRLQRCTAGEPSLCGT